MQRRKFIQQTVFGLPIAISINALLSACEKDEPTVNVEGKKLVLVVGAGIAGLAAAKQLKEAGFQVTVIESQEKVGGRLRTNRSLGIPFDEGASWIHGIKGNPLVDLSTQSGATAIQTDDNSLVAYNVGGQKYSDTTYTKAEDNFYAILETLMKKGAKDVSFETVYKANYPNLVNDKLYKFLVSAYLTFDTGDLDKLSSLYYNEGELYDDDEKLMTDGYDHIPNYLAKDLTILLNERVTKIDYSGSSAKVTTNNGSYEADYVIVTVPLGVLKKNAITFMPTLPTQKQAAINKVGMNCVNKFIFTWDKTFWDDKLYIAYTPEVVDKFNYFINVNQMKPNSHALLTFAYAQFARDTESMTDEQIIEAVMTHLKDMYGKNIPYPKNMQRTKWQSNPNTYGAYSYTALGMEMSQFDDLATEVNNKLFFGGEHTHIEYFSTAHGAYLSGLREATKIIDLQK
jgi:monoamine oxidase